MPLSMYSYSLHVQLFYTTNFILNWKRAIFSRQASLSPQTFLKTCDFIPCLDRF